MLQALLTAYVVVRWLGAWSLLGGAASGFLYAGLCVFALTGFITSMLSPGSLRALGMLIGDGPGGYGVLVAPILWILFFILYPLGLVDWLVALHALKSPQGLLFSGETPCAIDITALILFFVTTTSIILKVRKLLKKEV